MERYSRQLAIEAVSVGAMTVGAFIAVRSMLSESSLLTQLFVTGAGLHLTLEGLGLNAWYLKNGASSF
tara:strand:- start:157 stop:360 length:204 start_codon:yes stop_codon:yes gene_type:complete